MPAVANGGSHIGSVHLLSRGRPQRCLVFRIDERTGQEDGRVRQRLECETECGIVDAPHLGGVPVLYARPPSSRIAANGWV
jgi:hypothetical protein